MTPDRSGSGDVGDPPREAERKSPSRILALINPEAGRFDGSRVKEAILSGLDDKPLRIDFIDLEPGMKARHITEKAAAQGYDLVLVAGGDGTLAEAAAGLVGTPLPIGIIPTGTGNIVAANLGIPMSPRLAARAALSGTAQAFDVGLIDDGRIFLLAAGAGYDANLIRDADRELKRRFGPLAYLFAMFKNLRVKRARFVVEIDDKKLHFHAKTVLVCNVGRTLGALPLAPDALVDDGHLDVVVFTFTGFGHLLLLFFKAVFGGLKQDPRVRFLKARRVRLTASRPMPVQVDGEFVDLTTPIEMSVLPGGLMIVRPPKSFVMELASMAENAIKMIREFPARLSDEARAAPQLSTVDDPKAH